MKKEKLSAASKSKLEAETKSNTEMIDELIFMTSHSSVEDLDVDKVAAYLEMLDERAPIDEPLGENEADTWERVLERTAVADSLTDEVPRRAVRKRRVSHIGKIMRGVVVAAAIIIAFSCIAAFASGANPFETVVKVAGDLIFFARNPSGELELPEGSETEYKSLRKALDATGMEDAMCPSWIPKDYSVEMITAKKTSLSQKVTGSYSSDRGEIVITITRVLSDVSRGTIEVEKNGYEMMDQNGDMFYISDNVDMVQAYATIDSYEYYLIGNIDRYELKTIIQSLYR